MRGRYLAALISGALLLLSACGGPGGGTSAIAPPTELTATAGDRDADLSWQASTSDTVEKYNVYQGTTSGDLSKVGEVNGSTLTYRASGLANGTEYFFAVDAQDSGGKQSVKSNETSATPADIDEHTPPTVRTTSPHHGATGVGTNVNIVVTFSKSMNPLSTEAAFTADPALDCDFSWKSAGKRLTCKPIGGLDMSQTYIVTIGTGAQDLDGNSLVTAKKFTFKTGVDIFNLCVFGASEYGACTFGP